MGDAADGKVKQVTEWHANIHPNKTEKYANAFDAKYGGPPANISFYYLRVKNEMSHAGQGDQGRPSRSIPRRLRTSSKA